MSLHLDEPVGINPCVNIVFLTLFGDPAHESVLIDFLNAVLAPSAPIVRAMVRNPFHPAQFEDHKSLILDIEARDEAGRTLQVEMQRRSDRGLNQRMLYGWARLYSEQLEKGHPYEELRPVVSVWVCEEDVFPQARNAHLRFGLIEVREGFPLHTDIRFEVLQLGRWTADRDVLIAAPVGAWFWFFNEAERWRSVPPQIDSDAMEAAMRILNDFRTDSHLNYIYRGQVEAERVELGRQRELEDARAELDDARAELDEARAELDDVRAEKERERAEKEQALAAELAQRARVEQLQARLLALGINPDGE